ncbi:MAG: VCBS repeat-containing protein [Anaerolinea sp.]|nr:VCBS repeat-containing protein [Anaerolinea sp.]
MLAIKDASIEAMNRLQQTVTRPLLVIAILLLIVVACSPEETVEIVEQEAQALEATILPPIAPTPTPSRTVLPTVMATVTPVPTMTATATTSPTATMTPAPRLTTSQPNLADLQEYLVSVPARVFSEEHNEALLFEGYFQEFPLSEHAEIVYQDINNDGLDDMIVFELQPSIWGRGILLVMIWQTDGYGDPLLLVNFAKYDPRHRFLFEDWSGDGAPEIIYDFQSDTGGTDYIDTTRTRYVIHCQEQCAVIWWKVIGEWEQFYTVGWTHTTIERSIDDETPNLSVLTESFYAPQLQNILSDSFNPGFQVLTSTLEIYTWNETRFELVESQILSLPYYFEAQPIWTTTNKSGIQAHLIAEFSEETLYPPIYVCSLHIENNWTSEPFDCDPGFTSVEWRDITDDGQDELVVTALAFAQQRLLAFQWNGTEAVQIADVTGDIIRVNLFGVAVDDVDSDGRMEIRAGKIDLSQRSFCRNFSGFYPDEIEICWQEWNFTEEVYRWNGVAYIKQD